MTAHPTPTPTASAANCGIVRATISATLRVAGYSSQNLTWRMRRGYKPSPASALFDIGPFVQPRMSLINFAALFQKMLRMSFLAKPTLLAARAMALNCS